MGESIKVLIAAAGRGTRAGLPYPKTLHPVAGTPILVRILDVMSTYDPSPTVVVSPDGAPLVSQCLADFHRSAHLVEQSVANGMGNAVLRFESSPSYPEADHVLLIWGDIPFVQQATVDAMVKHHLEHHCDFTFATRLVENPYTVVTRAADGKLLGLSETRELGISPPIRGERDIGLFIFRRDLVMEALEAEAPGKYGASTGEHGFLYLVSELAKRGCKVEGLPIATEEDLVSLNRMTDLEGHA